MVDKLNLNIDFIKNERDEKIVQIKNIITQMENFENKSIIPIGPSLRQDCSGNSDQCRDLSNKKVTINRYSQFSIKTNSTGTSVEKGGNQAHNNSVIGRTFEEKQNEIQEKIENLQNQKINLENELVQYKLKYAENQARIMELEDAVELIQEKYDVKFFSLTCRLV